MLLALALVAGLAATPAGPGDFGALLPMMLFAGRRRSGAGGNRGYGTGVYDPYQCAATCSAQMGFCPEPTMLQVEETGPVPPAPKPKPNGFMGNGAQAMLPMLMMAGSHRRASLAGPGMASSPLLQGCIQTCQTNSGCGAMVSGGSSKPKGAAKSLWDMDKTLNEDGSRQV